MATTAKTSSPQFAGYRVITFDRRGWGRSTANPDTGPQPGTIADDLHALVGYLRIDRTGVHSKALARSPDPALILRWHRDLNQACRAIRSGHS